MSNQHKVTASPPWIAKKVWMLPTALVVALVALVSLAQATAFAQSPLIQITKTGPTEVTQGSNVIFNISITNPGPVDLKNVQLVETCDVGPTQTANGNGDAILNMGETWTYTCQINNVQQSFTNYATANAVSNNAAQNPVSATDDAPVTVLTRGVHLTKTVRYPAGRDYFLQGETAEFVLGIRNTGQNNIKQADITLTDLLCSPVVNPKTQAPGDFDANGADDGGVAGEIDGSASGLTGETWTYLCQVPNVASDVVNQASVSVKDSGGVVVSTFSHNATATATVFRRGLSISKTANKSVVAQGEKVTWTVKIYNTGNIDLGIPSISDPACPLTLQSEGGNNDGTLDPGETWSYVCEVAGGYTVAQSPVKNEATVTTPLPNTASATASATITVVNPQFQFIVDPPIQYVMKGATATIQYKVTNTGVGALRNVEVKNPQCTTFTGPTGDDGDGEIDAPTTAAPAGETWTYTCTFVNVQTDKDPTEGTFQAKDAAGNPVPATPPARLQAKIFVINPGLNIKKTVDPVVYNGTATFNIQVTNKGNLELLDNNSTDGIPYPMPVDAFCDTGTLVRTTVSPTDGDNNIDPNEVWNYQCTKASVKQGFDNTASISVKDATGNVYTASDTVKVQVLTPGLSLQKLPAYQTVEVGTFDTKEISWTLRLHNTGASDLTPNGGVVDWDCSFPLERKADAPGNNDNVLNKNETWIYVCRYTVNPGEAGDLIQNYAYAYFTDGLNTLYSEAYAYAAVVGRGIALQKSADPAVALPGQAVKFTFQVGNPNPIWWGGSSTELINVEVKDAMCPGGKPTRVSGDANGDNKLQNAEVWVYECTVSGQQNDFTNVATVVGTVAGTGIPQSSTATASVHVINAKLDVDKTANRTEINQGDSVSFNVAVKNTGAVQLKEVTPVDDKCTLSTPTGDTNSNGLLDTTETWNYTCTVANVQANFRNTVNVTAKEVGSNLLVSGSDFVDVTVVRPGINIDKIANTTSVTKGGTASFTILVSNAGSTNLTNVNPVDANCTLVALSKGNGDAVLNVGETWVYSCAVANVQGTNGSFTNVASVTATDSNGIGVSAQDAASVTVTEPVNASIDVQKTGPASATAGSNVTFQVNVVNNGNVALTSVNVSDPLCTLTPVSLGNGDATLDVGETWSYTCTVNNVAAGTLTNTASATAQGPAGQVSDSATATVSVTGGNNGSLVLAQTVNPSTIAKGGSATFQATLANGTATNMTGVSLSGDKCKSFTRQSDAPGNNDATLNSGETWVWQCVLTKVTKTTTNKVTAKIKAPKQTLTASIKLTVTSSRGLIIDEDPNEASGVEVLVDGEGKVIDEAQLINKNYLPIVIGEEE